MGIGNNETHLAVDEDYHDTIIELQIRISFILAS